MSSSPISGGGPSVPSGLPPTDPDITPLTSNQTEETVLPPVANYQALPFSSKTFATLGLDLPQTPDDIMALLADVSDALERTVTELRDHREISIASKVRSNIGGLAFIIGTMTTLFLEHEALREQRDAKVTERTAKESQRSSLQTTSSNLQSQINTLNQQIASTPPAQQAPLIAARDSLVAQKAAVDSQISALTGEINALTAEISSLEGQMQEKLDAYFLNQATMLFVYSQTALFLFGLAPINLLLDFARDSLIAQVFDNIAERLRSGSPITHSDLGPLSFLDKLRAAVFVQRLAEVLGLNIDRNQAANLLEALNAGQIGRPSILGLVMVAAVNSLTIDQLQDADIRGRIITAALGLVVGLSDLVTVLAALDHLDAIDPSDALIEGLRLKLAI